MSDTKHTPTMDVSRLYPYCQKCGWRKGGVDSWDGTRCKCGHMASKFYVHDFDAHITETGKADDQ